MRLIHGQAARAAQASFRAGDGLAGLEGSLVALVTPFRHGHVDGDALSALCERQVQRGSAGLVVCGSTGEAPALLPDEHMRVVSIAAEAVAGRVPVIAGCGAPSTDAAVALARVTVRSGADALMCAPPPYVRPTQDGIAAHVRAVADAAGSPVILYDVPGRTGVAVTDGTVARLHGRGLICGLKDAAGDLSRPVRLRAAAQRRRVSRDEPLRRGPLGGDGSGRPGRRADARPRRAHDHMGVEPYLRCRVRAWAVPGRCLRLHAVQSAYGRDGAGAGTVSGVAVQP